MQKPKVSVITVNFNNKKGLKLTLDSVLKQTFISFEYIVIDGGSTDGSVELLKQYEEKFYKKSCKFIFLSEKDNGIYDAMNKGIALTQGEWIHFLNSGDSYYSSQVLENVFKNDDYDETDVIYGKWKKVKGIQIIEGDVYASELVTNIVDKHYDFLKPYPKQGVLLSAHLAMFFKGDLMRKYPYSLEYPICADLEWCMGAYHTKKRFYFINEYICLFDLTGVSNTRLFDTYKETLSIRHKYGTQDSLVLEKLKLFIWFLKDKFRKHF